MAALVVCAHGTRSPTGQATVRAIVARVARLVPGVRVAEAYVDVQEPELDDVVAGLIASGERVVVVPLLLSTGFHTEVDVARTVRRHPGRAVSAGPLGPHPALATVAVRRLTEAGATPPDTVVLAVAGSSRPESAAMGVRAGELLSEAWGAPVRVGFAAARQPDVPTAVQDARADRRARHESGAVAAPPGRVVVASYLIGEGYFHDALSRSGADLVTAPLGDAPEVAALVVERYRSALPTLDSAEH